ncbi:hypothetical protein ACGFIG_10365 [Micromonospora sp. NPDC049048]|uniref:hypothetical protein n=1 Tax=Micromonospora sp. NPDC049048 TaxID=3364263 RepID=UPI0037154C87
MTEIDIDDRVHVVARNHGQSSHGMFATHATDIRYVTFGFAGATLCGFHRPLMIRKAFLPSDYSCESGLRNAVDRDVDLPPPAAEATA